MPPDPQHPPNESEGDKEKNETLESPVPIFLGQLSHKRDRTINSSIQVVRGRVRFEETDVRTILFGQIPQPSTCQACECDHWDNWPCDDGI